MVSLELLEITSRARHNGHKIPTGYKGATRRQSQEKYAKHGITRHKDTGVKTVTCKNRSARRINNTITLQYGQATVARKSVDGKLLMETPQYCTLYQEVKRATVSYTVSDWRKHYRKQCCTAPKSGKLKIKEANEELMDSKSDNSICSNTQESSGKYEDNRRKRRLRGFSRYLARRKSTKMDKVTARPKTGSNGPKINDFEEI